MCHPKPLAKMQNRTSIRSSCHSPDMNVVAEGGLLPEAATSGEDIRGLNMTDKRIRKTSKIAANAATSGSPSASLTICPPARLDPAARTSAPRSPLTVHRSSPGRTIGSEIAGKTLRIQPGRRRAPTRSEPGWRPGPYRPGHSWSMSKRRWSR